MDGEKAMNNGFVFASDPQFTRVEIWSGAACAKRQTDQKPVKLPPVITNFFRAANIARQVWREATPRGFEPLISTVTGWHGNTTGLSNRLSSPINDNLFSCHDN
jgi:hypothetical protein